MLNLKPEEIKDIEVFCKLNEFTDVNEFVKECFNKGYQIEKYGLLTIDGQTVIEREVIKEVIKEVPVEVIKEVTKEVEVEVVKEVIVEKPVEIIKEVLKEVPVEVIKEVPVEKVVVKEVVKEVPVEKIVEKEVYITDEEQVNELLLKIQQLENKEPEVIEKEVIKEVEVVKEVEVQVEVIKEIEKPIEVIKEVIKEVEIIKEVENKDKQKKLQDSIKQLREDNRKKDDIILQLEKNVVELQKVKGPIKGQFMKSSNLNDNLYR